MSSSVGPIELWKGPAARSVAAISRSPSLLRTTIVAPSASITDPRSPDGSACASEPPIVPRLRTIGSEIIGAAAAIVG